MRSIASLKDDTKAPTDSLIEPSVVDLALTAMRTRDTQTPAADSPGAAGSWAIPLVVNDHSVGCLYIDGGDRSFFSQDASDLTFLTALTSHVGVAIDRARLVKQWALEKDDESRQLRADMKELQQALYTSKLIYESEQKLLELSGMSSREVREAGVRLEIAGPIAAEKRGLEKFLHQRLYRHADLVEGREAAQAKIKALVDVFLNSEHKLPATFRSRCQTHGSLTSVIDYVAGMTDHFFLETYQQLAG